MRQMHRNWMQATFALFMVAVMAGPAAASNIIVLTNEGAPGRGDSMSDFLGGLGYEVTVSDEFDPDGEDLSQSQIDELNSYDLVVTQTRVNRGDFGSATFNEVETPLLLTMSWLMDGGRAYWEWLPDRHGRDLNASTNPLLHVHDESHPIFDGVTITDGTASIFSDGSGTTRHRIFDMPSSFEGINGTPLGHLEGEGMYTDEGQIVTTDIDAVGVWTWEAGESFHIMTDQVAAGRRTFVHLPYNDDLDDWLNDDGRQLLANAVTYTIPEPGSLGLLGLGAATLLMRRRQAPAVREA